jgi:hypothetical protein
MPNPPASEEIKRYRVKATIYIFFGAITFYGKHNMFEIELL